MKQGIQLALTVAEHLSQIKRAKSVFQLNLNKIKQLKCNADECANILIKMSDDPHSEIPE